MKRRRRYLADGPARRASRSTAGACARSARIRTTHSLGADGPARRASRSSAGAGTRSARIRATHSPAADRPARIDRRTCCQLSLRNVDAQSVINWTVVGQLS